MLHIRRETIKDIIAEEGAVNVQDLMARFDVSIETIRRDLEALEKSGYLRRVYGGAIAVRNGMTEPNYFWRQEHNQREKAAVAAAVAGLIKDEETILLSYGTTMREVARRIRNKRNITVITNSISNVVELADCPGITTFCLGGRVRSGDMSTAGVLAEQNLRFFHVDKVITGFAGITQDAGITDCNLGESELLRVYVNTSPCVIAACDHSKLGQVSTYDICSTAKLTHLVVDDGLPEADLSLYRAQGVNVHLVHIPHS